MEKTVEIKVEKIDEFYDTHVEEEKGEREDSDIIFLRKFNNFIKSALIN